MSNRETVTMTYQDRVARRTNAPARRPAYWISGMRYLTHQELKVVLRLAVGCDNHQIAADLGVSVKTIDTHRGNVLAKLDFSNNVELARWAIRCGLVDA